MFSLAPWLRSGALLLSVLSLSALAVACSSADEMAEDPDLASTDRASALPEDRSAADTNAAPEKSEVTESAATEKPVVPGASGTGTRSAIAPSQSDPQPQSGFEPTGEIVGESEDGFNIFYQGIQPRCADPSLSSQDDDNCLIRPVVRYSINRLQMTAAVDCSAGLLGDVVINGGGHAAGMSKQTSPGMVKLMERACQEPRLAQYALPAAEEPMGEPGYVGYDIIGNTDSGQPVYFISSQPVCEDGSQRPDCDRREVNLVIDEANSSAVVFCSTGNFNELTIGGTLVSYLMQPKTGVYADVVKRVCAE